MKRSRAFYSAIPVLIVMAVIFLLSAQSGTASGKSSEIPTAMALWVLRGERGIRPVTEQDELWLRVSFYVRKLAHFAEFGALGFFLTLHLNCLTRRPERLWLPAWIFSCLYAVTDELHQFFSVGRSPSLRDCLIDWAGAAAGAAIMIMILRRIKTPDSGSRREQT